jgi:beta-phosphoglucomutase-like phosphatase (HAD superfamily)
LFSRFFVDTDIFDAVNHTLHYFKKPTHDTAKITEAIATEFRAKISTAPVRPIASALIKKTKEANGEIIGVSSFDLDTAATMLTTLGLDEDTACIEARSGYSGGYGADVWTRAMRMTGLLPRACIVLVATARSTRGALMANLNVAALATDKTERLDFTGADLVCSGTAKDADAIVALVRERCGAI